MNSLQGMGMPTVPNGHGNIYDYLPSSMSLPFIEKARNTVDAKVLFDVLARDTLGFQFPPETVSNMLP